MIRNLESEDLEQVMAIWLNTNLEAHHFIPKSYWENNYMFVKDILPKGDVSVFQEDGIIKGFVGMVDNYIAGFFVAKAYQGQGIGKQLLEHCQSTREHLLLDVYMENEQAVKFYTANGFIILTEKDNHDTQKREYAMGWQK